jgi:SAM-dependent methyltransferase
MRLLEAFLRRYAAGQARDVAPWIVGPRVLDLGAGEGFVAGALGAGVAVDVGPFRRVAVPYVVYDGTALPFGEATFGTTLLLLTLHHCHDAEAVLDEAVRVTGHRLIVTESVHRTRLDRFWLRALDGRFNRLRHSGRMAAPLAFRTDAEWTALFTARGLRPIATAWLGSRAERLIHHPRLYVLNLPAADQPPGRKARAMNSGNRSSSSATSAAPTSWAEPARSPSVVPQASR